jgi:hypothetical protein
MKVPALQTEAYGLPLYAYRDPAFAVDGPRHRLDFLRRHEEDFSLGVFRKLFLVGLVSLVPWW